MFGLPTYLRPVAAHKETKDSVLGEIKKLCQDSRCFIPRSGEQVFTDYMIPSEASARKYKDEVIDSVMPNIEEFSLSMGAKKLNMGQIWFQRYETDFYHGTHNHWPSLFSVIYYLEFDPSEHESTVLMNPNRLHAELYRAQNIQLETSFSPKIKEGDILIFPSFVDHYAPMNKSKMPRTIVSFNFDMSG